MFHSTTFRAKNLFGQHDLPWLAMYPWYAKWEWLTPAARLVFLNNVKVPKHTSQIRNAPSVSPDSLDQAILHELKQAGFLVTRMSPAKKTVLRVYVPDSVIAFANYVHAICHGRLTVSDNEQPLAKFCHVVFNRYQLGQRVGNVLRSAKRVCYFNDLPFQRYVLRGRWPEWVCNHLGDALAEQIMERVWGSDAPLTRCALKELLPGQNAGEIDAALAKLLEHLALVEDVHVETGEIVVGVHPIVRWDRLQRSRPRVRPALDVCPTPAHLGPSGSLLVDDLRVLLMEFADQPPRAKTNGSLFQKEETRLVSVMPKWPEWLESFLDAPPHARFQRALHWSRHLKFADDTHSHGEPRCCLTKKGSAWLASSVVEQFTSLYAALSAIATTRNYGEFSDANFLGTRAAVFPKSKSGERPSAWNVPEGCRVALRDALYQAIGSLPANEFCRYESVLAHLSFADHTPLLTGKRPEQVVVFYKDSEIHDMEDDLEPASREVLERHIKDRLIPLGCVNVGVDDAGKICITKHPRFDAYYGRIPMSTELVQESAHAAKVIVQPDFSIIVIGMNPAPAAELAPFCERVKGHAGQGSITLKITRDSIMKAATHGLSAKEIFNRLQKHADNAVPKNVAHEIKEWSNWVRLVQEELLLVIRCPDMETSERVMSAFRAKAIRLGDSAVGLRKNALTGADRQALKKHGVLVTEPKSNVGDDGFVADFEDESEFD